MTQGNEIKLQKGIDYKLLDDARELKNLTFDDLEKRTKVPKDTIKNMLNGRTKNPGVENLAPVCRELDIPIEKVLHQDEQKAIETQGIKEENVSILALKEIYETQNAAMKEINEAHIANIRAHYEQHHEDLKDNYEKRLADKREIIEILKEENTKLTRKFEAQEKSARIGNIIRNGIIALFVIGVIILLVMEFIHPEHGWLRF